MFQNPDQSFLQSRQKYHKRQRNNSYEDEINNLFNKKFRFRFDAEWKLADRSAWFTEAPWSVKELETLKSRLNFHKSQLNDFNIEEWSSHTRRRNPSGEVCWKLKCLINPEFLTQAWTKFYECAYTFNIIPPEVVEQRKMVSLHLCEAPGAFIASLNHYLQSHYPDVDWHWIASTLNPYYEGNSLSNMISDDRFMFHTLPHWDFGLDNTGNLMDWENSQAIIKKAKALGKVMLVTADGSIDCLQKPDAQEEITSPLHYCEIVTALQALSKGGTLVFKLFTIFEHSTVNLMYLINHLFHEVNIYKPVTSRQGNSEVYAVCLNFKGEEHLNPHIPVLKSAYGTEVYTAKTLFPLASIPEEFLKQIEECAFYFCSIQCQVINSNLQAYLMQNSLGFQIDVKKIRTFVAAEFIRLYNLAPLEYENEILKGILHEENKINTNPRYHRGSYTERQQFKSLTLKEKANNLKLFLQKDVMLNPSIFINEQVRWVELYDDKTALTLSFTYGKPLDKIYSSKFIFVPIFKLYQQILAEAEFMKLIIVLENGIQRESDLSYIKQEVPQWTTLSFPDYDYNEDYYVFEKRCFKTLLNNLRSLKLGESLLLQNFNTLTHFNISVLYVLCSKCFKKTGFTQSDGIILNNFMNKDAIKMMEIVSQECSKCDIKDVLSVLPVQVTYVEIFFNNIVFYNNTFYRNKCDEYLREIEKGV